MAEAKRAEAACLAEVNVAAPRAWRTADVAAAAAAAPIDPRFGGLALGGGTTTTAGAPASAARASRASSATCAPWAGPSGRSQNSTRAPAIKGVLRYADRQARRAVTCRR